MKILGIIPARGGSKRIPGKNKKKLDGKELVRYSIESTLKSKEITDFVLSSDDEDILRIGSDYKNLNCLRRPEAISGDKASAISYVQHAIEVLKIDFDYIVIIQPTSPFTMGRDIDNTIRLLYDSDADSSVTVMRLDHAIHPIKMKTMAGEKLNPFLEEEGGRMAAHELPELYVRNCSVYVSTMENIHQGKIIGDHCLGFVMPRERSIDINDPIDFEFAEYLITHKKTF
jgi:CMP-N,N'-diacetyllegionaminic acid synthase